MNETRARELFIDSLKEPLSPTESAALSEFLATNPGLRTEFEQLRVVFTTLESDPVAAPSASARESVFAAISAETTASHGRRSDAPSLRRSNPRPLGRLAWIGCAAVFLVALGFLAGLRVGRGESAGVAAGLVEAGDPRSPASTGSGQATAVTSEPSRVEVADWDQAPGPVRVERMLEGNDSVALPRLLAALAADPSAGVRLTAIRALDPRVPNASVRAAVAANLSRDPSPIVQIAMLEYISQAGGPDAIPTLTNLARNESVDQSVRDAAFFALAQY